MFLTVVCVPNFVGVYVCHKCFSCLGSCYVSSRSVTGFFPIATVFSLKEGFF